MAERDLQPKPKNLLRKILRHSGLVTIAAAASFALGEEALDYYNTWQIHRALRQAAIAQEESNVALIDNTLEGETVQLLQVYGGEFLVVPRPFMDDAVLLALSREESGEDAPYVFLESADCLFRLARQQGKLGPLYHYTQKSSLHLDRLDILIHERAGSLLPIAIGRVDSFQSGDVFEVCPVNRTFALPDLNPKLLSQLYRYLID